MSEFELRMPIVDLTALLARAGGCSNTRSPLPIMSCVLLQATDDALTASSTNSIVSERSSAKATVKKPGQLCVDAKSFDAQVKSIKAGEVTLKRNGSSLDVRCGGSRFKLPCQDAESFPTLPTVDGAKPIAKIEPKALARLIAQGAYAVSTNETLQHLTPAYFELTPKSISVVSTDGHRLALAQAALTEAVECKLAVPQGGLSEMRKLCGSADGEIELYRSGQTLLMRSGDTTVSVLLGDDAACPPYRKLIPAPREHSVVMSRELLISAVKRVGLVAASLVGCGIRLDLVEGALSISASAADSASEAQDKLECACSWELSIGTSGRYMEAALAAFDADEVAVDFGGPLDPIVVRAADLSGDALSLCMPMRLG